MITYMKLNLSFHYKDYNEDITKKIAEMTFWAIQRENDMFLDHLFQQKKIVPIIHMLLFNYFQRGNDLSQKIIAAHLYVHS